MSRAGPTLVSAIVLALGACTSASDRPTAVPSAASAAAASPAGLVPTPALSAGSRGGPLTDPRPCPAEPVFTVLPMDPADFISFRPLGFPQPPIHVFGAKHSAFTINLPGAAPVHGRPVRFPSDATVTLITSTESREGSGFQVTFSPCRDLKSYLFHLGSLAPALAAALGGASASCATFDFGAQGGTVRKCEAKVALQVRAGDAVGGNDAFAGVDWGLVDYRVSLGYANLARYDGDYPHVVSPLDYSVAAVRAALEQKVGSFDGSVRRTTAPVAGTVMQDLPGTAQGNWFTPGATFMNTTNFEPFLALLHDHVEPSVPILSMGTSVRGLPLGLYSFTPRASGTIDRDFSDVKPDGRAYCWEPFTGGRTRSGLNLGSSDGALVMSMPSATTLRVELRRGATCASAAGPGPEASSFER